MRIQCNLCAERGQETNVALIALKRHLEMAHSHRGEGFEWIVKHYTQIPCQTEELV